MNTVITSLYAPHHNSKVEQDQEFHSIIQWPFIQFLVVKQQAGSDVGLAMINLHS